MFTSRNYFSPMDLPEAPAAEVLIGAAEAFKGVFAVTVVLFHEHVFGSARLGFFKDAAEVDQALSCAEALPSGFMSGQSSAAGPECL